MRYVYHARLETDPAGGFIVTFPDVPEAITSGADRREALENAADGLGCALRLFYLAEGKNLPAAKYRGGTEILPDTWDSLKVALIQVFRLSGMTQKELAARLEIFPQEVQRLLDPKHSSKVQAMERALALMGKRPIISFMDIPAAA